MSVHARVLLAVFAVAVFAIALASLTSIWIALFAIGPVAMWTAHRITRALEGPLQSLEDGLHALRDGDFGMRLAWRGGDRVAHLRRLYNETADLLRARRNDVYQKELLLDTILQRTPVAVLLISANDRVVYSNAAARELFGGRLDGHLFDDIAQSLRPEVRDAIAAGGDAILTVPSADREETLHLSQRWFRLNTVEHRLLLAERLTAELRRQEIAVWKNAIRLINHELNNTVAPISSMIHSARVIAESRPDRKERLPEIYATIEERLAFLRGFLESYAQFARLPAPRMERTEWRAILEDVRALYAFRIEGDVAETANVDAAQMQQLVINLVKNAHESGSDPNEIVVSLQRAGSECVLRVVDRGQGMTEDVLRHALVPFYSTKPGGSGVGLALCNEIVEAHGGRMRLQGREGGGVMVTCWLPTWSAAAKPPL